MLFDVYGKLDLTPVHAEGAYLWDDKGVRYLDCYGGHGVISIGHNHPHWVELLEEQLKNISFYSNAVRIPIQEALSEKLSRQSGYPDHALFLVNSGAEANENALKVAGFHTGRSKVIAFRRGFHGRTSGTMAVSDYPGNHSAFNHPHHVAFFEFDQGGVFETLQEGDVAAVIIEGIQGIAGVVEPPDAFLQSLSQCCKEVGTMLILDEVQSGFARSGQFFAHQRAGIKADIVTMAKGMGNGFPVGGLLISPEVAPRIGMLGTTFGGSYLASSAVTATLDVIADTNLVQHVDRQGEQWKTVLAGLPGVHKIRGSGFILGLEFEHDTAELRSRLLKAGVITGSSSNPDVIRLLPPLCSGGEELDLLIDTFNKIQ